MADPLIDNEPDPARLTVQLLLQFVVGGFEAEKAQLNNIQTYVWNSPYRATPQQVFDEIGTRGGSLVAYVVTTLSYLNSVRLRFKNPGEEIKNLKPPGVIVTVNPDGTVTLS
jgi:hypothetical protein